MVVDGRLATGLHAVATLIAVAATLVVRAPAARADDAATLLAQVNSLRAAKGLGPLVVDPTMASVAQSWSDGMAATMQLAHNGNLRNILGTRYADPSENVGFAGTIGIAFNDFVNNQPHLAIMLGDFNVTGIGVASAGGYLWVTEDFALTDGSPAISTPTTRTSAPDAVPRPTTTAATSRAATTMPLISLPATGRGTGATVSTTEAAPAPATTGTGTGSGTDDVGGSSTTSGRPRPASSASGANQLDGPGLLSLSAWRSGFWLCSLGHSSLGVAFATSVDEGTATGGPKVE